MMNRIKTRGLWSLGLLLLSLGCVEQPEQIKCERSDVLSLCGQGESGSIEACCDVLSPIFNLQTEEISTTQSDFVTQCIKQFTVDSVELECLDHTASIDPDERWGTRDAVTQCARLYRGVDDVEEREQVYMLQCVKDLTSVRFTPSYARDPYALAVFCEKDNQGVESAEYSRQCIETLGQYAYFPSVEQPNEPNEALSTSDWRGRDSVPKLCARLGDPGACGGTTSGTLPCLTELQKLDFGVDNPGAFEQQVALLSNQTALGYGCKVCSDVGCVFLDTQCLQSSNTVGVMFCDEGIE